MFYKIIFAVLFILEILVILIFISVSKKKLSLFLANPFFGIMTLTLLNLLEGLTKCDIAINIVSVFYSLALGPIGPFLFVLIEYIFL